MKKLLGLLLMFSLIAIGCKDDETSNTSKISVGMIDSPTDLDSINLVVNEISVKVDSNWTVIFEGSQKINLLDFRDGTFKLFAENRVIEGVKIHEARLRISSAYVVKGTEKYVLTIPSGMTSGLKLKVKNGEIKPGFDYTLIVDLDAKRSFIKNKAKHFEYKMRPVLRAFLVATTGNIFGTVSGWSNNPTVYAISGSDTLASTIPDTFGAFKLFYLDEGTYSLGVADTLGGSKTYSGPFNVVKGQNTAAGTLVK